MPEPRPSTARTQRRLMSSSETPNGNPLSSLVLWVFLPGVHLPFPDKKSVQRNGIRVTGSSSTDFARVDEFGQLRAAGCHIAQMKRVISFEQSGNVAQLRRGLHERSLKRETPHLTKHAESRRYTTLASLGILATIFCDHGDKFVTRQKPGQSRPACSFIQSALCFAEVSSSLNVEKIPQRLQ